MRRGSHEVLSENMAHNCCEASFNSGVFMVIVRKEWFCALQLNISTRIFREVFAT